jgi:hypothetical protein
VLAARNQPAVVPHKFTIKKEAGRIEFDNYRNGSPETWAASAVGAQPKSRRDRRPEVSVTASGRGSVAAGNNVTIHRHSKKESGFGVLDVLPVTSFGAIGGTCLVTPWLCLHEGLPAGMVLSADCVGLLVVVIYALAVWCMLRWRGPAATNSNPKSSFWSTTTGIARQKPGKPSRRQALRGRNR